MINISEAVRTIPHELFQDEVKTHNVEIGLASLKHALKIGMEPTSGLRLRFGDTVEIQSGPGVTLHLGNDTIRCLAPDYSTDVHGWSRMYAAFGVTFQPESPLKHMAMQYDPERTGNRVTFYARDTLVGDTGNHTSVGVMYEQALQEILSGMMVAPDNVITWAQTHGVWFREESHKYTMNEAVALPAKILYPELSRQTHSHFSAIKEMPKVSDDTLIILEPRFLYAETQGPGMRTALQKAQPALIRTIGEW
ncbi:MAG TPA: hypothetical protein VMR81_04985 [Patescibacteria group bacterium]|nr:hypothetical protein [Patescibacteria group bacterium]